jgi:hypothetical protein
VGQGENLVGSLTCRFKGLITFQFIAFTAFLWRLLQRATPNEIVIWTTSA